MATSSSGSDRLSIVWMIPILLGLLAIVGLFVPVSDCDLCYDLRRSIKVSDLSVIDCPCCGHTMRLTLFHKWFANHGKHLDDFHKAWSS